MLKVGSKVRLRPFPMLTEMLPVLSKFEPADVVEAGYGVEHAKNIPVTTTRARDHKDLTSENRTGGLPFSANKCICEV
jgi:hypothetical protein